MERWEGNLFYGPSLGNHEDERGTDRDNDFSYTGHKRPQLDQRKIFPFQCD